MRRAITSLLLALSGFPAIAPLLLPNLISDLPACCRRDGKHRCSLNSMDTGMDIGLNAQSPGPAASSNLPKCPYYPASLNVLGERSSSPAGNSQAISISLGSQPAIETRIDARGPAFSRAHHQRGPPTPLA
jgi:hypothetical protein